MIRLAALIAFLIVAFFLVNTARQTTFNGHKSEVNSIINQIQ